MKTLEIPLKTCAGCKVGGSPILIIECNTDKIRYYYIQCDKCSEEVKLFQTKKEAIQEYLKRPRVEKE